MEVDKEHKELDCPTDPYETSLEWHDIGEANLDPTFLFPETENSKCSINKNFRKHATEENSEDMLWIQLLTPNVDKKDETVYCPYCDMKNHPRRTCNHIDKHRLQNERHTCTLCIDNYPPFLCPDATMELESQIGLRQRKRLQLEPNDVPPSRPAAQQAQAQPMDATGRPPPQQQAPPAEAPCVQPQHHAASTADRLTVIFAAAHQVQCRATATNDGLPKCSRRRSVDAHDHAASSSRTSTIALPICVRQSVESHLLRTRHSTSIGSFPEAHVKHVESECAPTM